MDAAKAAIKNFTSHGGHHETTVHEHVNPAVQQEKLHRKEIEEQQTVVDKEVHQDEYHTTVLPVKDREVLAEQHSHNLVGTENREYRHGDHEGIKERLAREAAEFKHTRTEGETIREQNVAPTVGGEHIHQHIHETVQPVIQKDTVQPVVVHTTIPVHETHHNAPVHHGASALPAMTMDEFRTRGGALEGCEDKVDRYEGIIPAEEAVKNTSHGFHHHEGRHHESGHTAGTGVLGTTGTTGTTGSTGLGHGHHGHHGHEGVTGTTGTGLGREGVTGNTGAGLGRDGAYANDSVRDGTTGTGLGRDGVTGTTGSGLGREGVTGTTGTGLGREGVTGTTGTTGTGLGHGHGTSNTTSTGVGNDSNIGSTTNDGTTLGGTGTTGNKHTFNPNSIGDYGSTGLDDHTATREFSGSSSDVKKPSLLDKLNPMKDSNGDGTKGFMK